MSSRRSVSGFVPTVLCTDDSVLLRPEEQVLPLNVFGAAVPHDAGSHASYADAYCPI